MDATRDEPREMRTCPGRDHADCFYTGNPWMPHEQEPYTCLQYTLSEGGGKDPALGKITAFASLSGADYSRGEQEMRAFERIPYRYDMPRCWKLGTKFETVKPPPFTWTRQVVLVKDDDPMGANYVVVHDDLSRNSTLEPALNLWSLTDGILQNGRQVASRVTAKGPLHLPGQWGVDLDIFVAEPRSAPIMTAELAYQSRRYDAVFKRLHGRKFEERQQLVRILQKPGGNFTVAVVPRKPEETQPEFEALDGISGIKMTVGDITHWVFVNATPADFADGPVRFSGTAGVVKKNGNQVSLHLLAQGDIHYGDVKLSGDHPRERTANVK